MNKFLIGATILATILFSGCNNFSPRLPKQEIENQNGRINGLENNQNALKIEIGRIANELGIQNSQVREMQQGWMNLQATVSRNDNSGIQILQGDGALFIVFATVTLAMLFYYVFQMEKYKKATSILAREIVKYENVDLKNRVLLASENTDVEQLIFRLTK